LTGNSESTVAIEQDTRHNSQASRFCRRDRLNECDFVAVEPLARKASLALQAWEGADTAMPTRSAAGAPVLLAQIWAVHRGTDAGRPWYHDASSYFSRMARSTRRRFATCRRPW